MAESPTSRTPKARKTQQRILDACLELFNARGPSEVTTAEIAARAGINEGNLYYYFRRKDQILETLFEAYAERLLEVSRSFRVPEEQQDPGAYLSRWFRLMWAWRFIYRDGTTILQIAPELRPRLQALSARGRADVEQVLVGLVTQGLMCAAPDEIERLVINTWIVASYVLDYLRVQAGVESITEAHVDWAQAQVFALVRPYLTPAGLATIASAAAKSR